MVLSYVGQVTQSPSATCDLKCFEIIEKLLSFLMAQAHLNCQKSPTRSYVASGRFQFRRNINLGFKKGSCPVITIAIVARIYRQRVYMKALLSLPCLWTFLLHRVPPGESKKEIRKYPSLTPKKEQKITSNKFLWLRKKRSNNGSPCTGRISSPSSFADCVVNYSAMKSCLCT